ncbi:uncharacterized protein LOC116129184 [Pistacia vera]|uniref:uncharacterized protein LOC116129184 n=1 Tax=Pistacia vera TaxID=55513 RepID=UPI001263DFDB|nr:uncharacterized protein LOC116129184 [Pistacia vera]
MIWDSQLPPMSDCYHNLTRLIIRDIGKLKYLFPSSMVKNFKQLQHLEIRSCKELKEIVTKERVEASPAFIFPRVEFLQLGNLPELTSFYPGIHTSKWPKLKKLQVHSCDKLQVSTSQCKVVFPNLEALELEAINSQMIRDSQLPPISDCYRNLTRLIIKVIGKLKYVFPSSMVKNFEHLQHLEIRYCMELKEIVAKEGVEAPPTVIFPRIEFLQLANLPELTTFYPGIHTSTWPVLKKLVVSNCHKLHICTSEYKVVFPNLEHVNLQAINSQMIWDSQLPPMSDCYHNLTRLIISDIGKLKYLFPSSMVKSFKQLQHIEIRSCQELKEIVAKEGAEALPTFIFPRVEFLKLGNLLELTTFYPGTHTSEWPKLKKLQVYSCDKLHIFTSQYKAIN